MPQSQPAHSTAIHGVLHQPPRTVLPAGSCDCHTHVFGPTERYPLAADRQYTPGQARLEDMLRLHDQLGIERVVIVHPSPYGSDNSCTLDALLALGERGRGVAVIDEKTSDAQLQAMHDAGVRGVRINLDVLNAQQQLVSARRDLTQARYNCLIAYLKLRMAAGTLDIGDLRTVARYFSSAG